MNYDSYCTLAVEPFFQYLTSLHIFMYTFVCLFAYGLWRNDQKQPREMK